MIIKNRSKKLSFLPDLEALLKQRKIKSPENSYTSELFNKGVDAVLQKFGEEAIEYMIAVKNNKRREKISEGADMLFHFIVSLVQQDISFDEIIKELEARHHKRDE